MDKRNLYKSLYSAVKLRYSDLSGETHQVKPNRLWVDLKEKRNSHEMLCTRASMKKLTDLKHTQHRERHSFLSSKYIKYTKLLEKYYNKINILS